MSIKNMSTDEIMIRGLNASVIEDQLHPDYTKDALERAESIERYGVLTEDLFDLFEVLLPNKQILTSSLLYTTYHFVKLLDNDQKDSPKAFNYFLTRFQATKLKEKALEEIKTSVSLADEKAELSYLTTLFFYYLSGVKAKNKDLLLLFEYLDQCFKLVLTVDKRVKKIYAVYLNLKK
jgi:hypothetical protein